MVESFWPIDEIVLRQHVENERGAEIADVLMYGLERTSYQPEAARIAKVDALELEAFADEVRASGIAVSVHP